MRKYMENYLYPVYSCVYYLHRMLFLSMDKMSTFSRAYILFFCLLISACSFHAYELELSDEQILALETMEKIIHRNMEKSRVNTALVDAGIKHSKILPYLYSGGYMEEKYLNVDAIFVDISPAVQTGCWDAVLVIIKFNADGRVSRIIKEYANFCG